MSETSCVACGAEFRESDMVKYGEDHVCADCKPAFFQKIKEGVSTSVKYEYKGFWIRFVAVFLDGILTQIVSTLIGLGIGFMMISSPDPDMQIASSVFSGLIGFLIGLSYEVVMVAKYGATLGKMACNVKVVRADGSPLSYPLSFGRYFAKMLSSLILLIGYIMAAFDEEKRALHDRICDTRVIARN